jgi:hypothetical protein
MVSLDCKSRNMDLRPYVNLLETKHELMSSVKSDHYPGSKTLVDGSNYQSVSSASSAVRLQ